MYSAIYSQSILSFLKLLVLRFNWKCLRIEGAQFYPISLSFSLREEVAVVEGGLFNLLNGSIHCKKSEQTKWDMHEAPSAHPPALSPRATAWEELGLTRHLGISTCPFWKATTWVSSPKGSLSRAEVCDCVCVCMCVCLQGTTGSLNRTSSWVMRKWLWGKRWLCINELTGVAVLCCQPCPH